MNRFYVDDYLRALGKKILGIKSFSSQFRSRQGTNTIDVMIKVTMR